MCTFAHLFNHSETVSFFTKLKILIYQRCAMSVFCKELLIDLKVNVLINRKTFRLQLLNTYN